MVVRCFRVLIFMAFVVPGCTKTSQYIDTSKESDNLFIVQTDTVQPSYVVYRLDSFQTSGANRAIIGQQTDPYFGFISSKTYCRFNLAAGNYLNIGAITEKYDSIRLIMRLDHTYYGDTSAFWHASVYPLAQDLDAPNTNYYNNQYLQVDSLTELGNASILVRPRAQDSIVIPLSNTFGSTLFDLYKSKNEAVTGNDAFQRYFKGLSIEPGGTGNVIYAFNAADTGTVIRLYYHDDQGVIVNKHLDFKAEGGNYQFNNIANDPTGTVTEAVIKDHDTPSELLSHKIFVSDLAGVVTKFTLPSVKTLATLPNYVRLQSVQLMLSPVPTSFGIYPLIPYLGLGAANETSNSLTPVFTADGKSVQSGSLFIDNLNGMSTGYTYDLSAVSRNEVLSTAYTTNTIYFQALSPNLSRQFSLNRLVAADNSNPVMPSKVVAQILFFKK